MICYLSSIVTMSLFCTVSEILSLISKIKRCHVTMTEPTEETVCNPSAKTSYGEPVYKKFQVSSFSRSGDILG